MSRHDRFAPNGRTHTVRALRRSALLSVLALVATACLGTGSEESGAEGEGGGGGTVEIFGAFSGDEEAAFNESLAPFEEESGIDVEYVSSSDFTTLITSRVEGGDPPDIALFPQPGALLGFADDDAVQPLDDVIDLAAIEESLIPGFLDATTGEDGSVYGVPMRMAVKSVVWYPEPEFEEAGYEVPETYEELMALTEQIAADGGTPWCIGAESGADTGWVITDWMEENMLRLHGEEVYDQWVANELPFDSPEVVAAGEMFGEIAFTDGYVLGGPQGILTTAFGDAPNPMFEDEPGCWLHRQGNFITGFFPDEVQEDLAANVGTFVYPGEEAGSTPILGGGDLAALFDAENEAAAQVVEYLGSDEFGQPWAEAGGWLSPHATFDTSLYPDETTQQIATLAQEGEVFRFDGSDLMPASVGAGSFWSEMVSWVNGQIELEEALANIEESWPAGNGASEAESSEEAS